MYVSRQYLLLWHVQAATNYNYRRSEISISATDASTTGRGAVVCCDRRPLAVSAGIPEPKLHLHNTNSQPLVTRHRKKRTQPELDVAF